MIEQVPLITVPMCSIVHKHTYPPPTSSVAPHVFCRNSSPGNMICSPFLRCLAALQSKFRAPKADGPFLLWALAVSAVGTCFVIGVVVVLLIIVTHVLLAVPLDIMAKIEGELLHCSGKVMDEYGITWFMDFGAVLGGIRHKGFLPDDYPVDIDISMMACDTTRLRRLIPVIEERCYATVIFREDFMITYFGSWAIRMAAFRCVPLCAQVVVCQTAGR